MGFKIQLPGMTVAALLLIILAGGCAAPEAAPELEQPPITSYMRSRIGTPDELSPLAPVEARNVRKLGNYWICDLNGQTMVYNNATARWEPQQK